VNSKSPAALVTVFILLLSGCASQAGYLAKQGGYLLRFSSGTRGVRSLIETASTPADTRDFLLRVQDIKRFAVARAGLRDNANYTRYKEIDRDHLVDVVQACDAVSFTAYEWSYPFLGKLPYKGFYERADADAEAARLRKEGWDVIIRPVDAFSTLGFTKDPLYSFMKRYSPYQLASLIIHEQTHATLFVKGQPEFNEELATFVGETGAFEWLQEKYGADSREYQAAVDEDADSRSFTSLLGNCAAELDTVYHGTLARDEKLAGKALIIDAFKRRLGGDLAATFRTEAYRNLGDLPVNNALISLYRLYSDDVPLLRAYWQQRCGAELPRFIEAVKALARRGDVKALMRGELAGGKDSQP
jgi:predicted aminopeptidase